MRQEENEAETRTRGNSCYSEGANGPVDQRSDFKEAKKTCDKLHREHAATARCGNTRIHPQEQVRQSQHCGGHVDSYRVDSESGWKVDMLAIILVATIRQLEDSAWNWDSSSWTEQ